MTPRIFDAHTPFIEQNRIRRVLIIKLTSLGDVLHALPVVSALKESFPFLEIHWAVEDRCASLLESHPLLDSVIIYPRSELERLIKKGRWAAAGSLLRKFRKGLRVQRFDLSLDLQGLAKSALVAWMAGARYRLGGAGLKEFSHLVSRPLPVIQTGHVVSTHLQTVELLGATIQGPPVFSLSLSQAEIEWGEAFLKEAGWDGREDIIGLQLGTVPRPKCWPLQKHRQLAERISALAAVRLVLFGDETDRRRLVDSGWQDPPRAINTTGRLSLRQLMSLIARCRIFIGGDSGPLHLAAAWGVPVVALFGGTDPSWSGPLGNQHRVIYKDFPCSPCVLTPRNKPGQCGSGRDCLEAIEVDEVLEAVLEIRTEGPDKFRSRSR